MAPPDRLRPHPRDRWPDKTQLIDLTAAVTGLRAETHHAIAGHRQIALGRDGPVTLLLFVFESGGFLKEHETDGVVTIHVLSGHVDVTVGEETCQLRRGQLLVVAPQVRHHLHAREPSETLVTVHKHSARETVGAA